MGLRDLLQGSNHPIAIKYLAEHLPYIVGFITASSRCVVHAFILSAEHLPNTREALDNYLSNACWNASSQTLPYCYCGEMKGGFTSQRLEEFLMWLRGVRCVSVGKDKVGKLLWKEVGWLNRCRGQATSQAWESSFEVSGVETCV